MTEEALSLMALEPLPRGDWLGVASAVLARNGFEALARPSELIVWQERRQKGGLSFADGWSIRRIWLAPKRSAIGLASRRLYFEQHSSNIDRRQEHLVVKGQRPASRPASEEIAAQVRLLDTLRDSLKGEARPVPLQPVDADVSDSRRARIRDLDFAVPPSKLDELYRKHGLDKVPEDFAVSVCALESTMREDVEKFVDGLTRAADQRRIPLQARIIGERSIESRLREIENSAAEVRPGKCVLFVLPRKAEEPSAKSMELFRKLQAAGVPFRRAYADDPLRYSIPDQLPSLVLAAGGRPHRSPTSSGRTPVWTVGVDLGHSLNSPTSVLTVTLVDPAGALVGAWTNQQRRDETPDAKSLSAMLDLCGRRCRDLDSRPEMVVLRDGRLFEKENAQLYEDKLGARVSLFECRKGGNPQIFEASSSGPAAVAPITCALPGGHSLFMSTLAARDSRSLPFVLKISWRPEWNGLDLDAAAVARILAASAAAPGLGLQPRHLPAAIYWADGIACTSSSDLRFAGVVRMDAAQRAIPRNTSGSATSNGDRQRNMHRGNQE